MWSDVCAFNLLKVNVGLISACVIFFYGMSCPKNVTKGFLAVFGNCLVG